MNNYYENLLHKWERTSKIGRCYCNTREQAERMAYIIAKVKEPLREQKQIQIKQTQIKETPKQFVPVQLKLGL